MKDGVILVDKPVGMTSFGVVARVRRVLSQEAGKKVKVGHTGTLDPFASGLMILVVGKECKNAASYSKLDKVYEATIRLGSVSATGDPEGEISKVSERISHLDELNDVIAGFRGEIRQKPPIYSALKINGQRAYKLAREGKDVEIPERTVTVYSLEVVRYDYPDVFIVAHVSSGTYIRSLASDIGESLGVGAYCRELRRIRVGEHTIKQAKLLKELGLTN